MATELFFGTSGSAVVLTGAAVALLVYLWFKSTASSSQLPPGPRGLEAVRGMLSALRSGSLNRQAQRWCQQYGSLVLCRSLLGDLCVVNSARLLRQLYSSKDTENVVINRPRTFFGRFVVYNFHDVAISSPLYLEEWGKMRKLFHHAVKFYGDGVERMESRVQEELRGLMSEIQTGSGHDVNMDHVISNSIMRVVLTLISGERPSPELVSQAKLFDHLTNGLFSPSTDTLLTSCPWLRHVPLLPYRKLFRDVIEVRDSIMHDLFTLSKQSHVPGQPRGIVDVLLDEKEKGDNQWLTDEHIRGLILDTVGAAFLTSTETLKDLFLYLVHNPHVARKVQEEIDLKIGDRTPRIQDRSDFPYTEAVVLETLRLASPVSMGLPHLTTRDVTLDGYTLPKGATVFANTKMFQRDPEVYDDPEVFQPERFLDDQGQLLPANHLVRQSMVPFGVGKRSCVGESFAKSRVFLYVTTLLQQFDILPPTKHQLLPLSPSSWINGIVLELKPYHVIFKPRSEKDNRF